MTKLKKCPWCGWSSTVLRVSLTDKGEPRYAVRCEHCGLTSRKSRFKWRAKKLWNRAKDQIPPSTKERKYHMYGREY